MNYWKNFDFLDKFNWQNFHEEIVVFKQHYNSNISDYYNYFETYRDSLKWDMPITIELMNFFKESYSLNCVEMIKWCIDNSHVMKSHKVNPKQVPLITDQWQVSMDA